MKENLLMLACFAGGILCGFTGLLPDVLFHPSLPAVLLSVLMLQVGAGLGAGEDLQLALRSFRLRMLLLPLFTIAGTLLFSALAVLLFHSHSLADILAVGSGFGYYSLSSVLIADLKGASAGSCAAAELATVALLANVVREMIALFGTPLFSRWGGAFAPVSIAGINSMDVCLPAILRATEDQTLAPVAVLHGIVLEMSVPLLIAFFC